MNIVVMAKLNFHLHGQVSWQNVPWYLSIFTS